MTPSPPLVADVVSVSEEKQTTRVVELELMSPEAAILLAVQSPTQPDEGGSRPF